VNVFSSWPIVENQTADSQFERKDNEPLVKLVKPNFIFRIDYSHLEDVVPTHSESPGWINETDGVGVETSRDRVHNSHFTEGIDNVEHHDTDDNEIDKNGSGTTLNEGTTRTDEETSSN